MVVGALLMINSDRYSTSRLQPLYLPHSGKAATDVAMLTELAATRARFRVSVTPAPVPVKFLSTDQMVGNAIGSWEARQILERRIQLKLRCFGHALPMPPE